MKSPSWSFARWWAIVIKEFIQLRREKVTFAMIMGVPLLQLILFGFAINADPKNLPVAVLSDDSGPFSRAVVAAMENTRYFKITRQLKTEEEGRAALAEGRVSFVLNIPPDFSSGVLRREKPAVLLEADAADPIAVGNALAAAARLPEFALKKDFKPFKEPPRAQEDAEPFKLIVHRLYNPEGITQYNIIPGLLGVILTMTLVMMTALSITRERERGAMENLLSMPVLPLEIMAGKIVPYMIIGLLQSTLILLAARFVFGVPFAGDAVLLYLAAFLFVAANSGVGILISSLAGSQTQALQMSIFYFLPNLMLSGFMFPFSGMPGWARAVGEVLPLTHFNRLSRGILLKGNTLADSWPDIWPLLIFALLGIAAASVCYKRTMD